MLAHLRFTADQTRGRRYPEPPHPYRNACQRDRDRIIHARAFRRLEHKTQVFTSPHSDHFRNRLTHTIEVSQIARTAASALALNEDLVEALALSHDIGHPPFGHSGEEVLNQQMQQFGAGFDHNLHALRIVENLEQRYAAFPRPQPQLRSEGRNHQAFKGLRLGVLSGVGRIPSGTGGPCWKRNSSTPRDEITYNCADLDDAIDAGLIDTDTARGEVPLFDRLMRESETSYPAASERQVFNEALRRTLDRPGDRADRGNPGSRSGSGYSERGTSSRLPREACRPEPPKRPRRRNSSSDCCRARSITPRSSTRTAGGQTRK